MPRRLPQVQAAAERLEIPTILDRSLAGLHGSDYVRLCAFAIDIDRIYVVEPDGLPLPFGWEVFITECFALARIDPVQETHHALLEDTCLSILEQSPDDQGYGSQLLFAVYDAIERGLYPASLRPVFRSWRKRPKQLLEALARTWASEPTAQLASLARHCLSPEVETELTPPLAPSSRAALEAMSARSWALPQVA